MARDPLASVGIVATPQTQPIPGRTDQVRNAAGGFVYAKDDWTSLEDFLILGTTGGTHHIGEDRLTTDNVDVLFRALAADGVRVVAMLTEISTSKPPRAPKNRPCLFALAAAYARGDAETRKAAQLALPLVARTTDHLATWFGYYKNLGGKPAGTGGTAPVVGRSVRNALASWFLHDDPDAVAFRACKAAQRATPAGEAFSLRDALRIAHPKPDVERRRASFLLIRGDWTAEGLQELLPGSGEYLDDPDMRRALFRWISGRLGRRRARILLPNLSGYLTLVEQRRALLGWIAGNVPDEKARQILPAIDAFLTAKSVTTTAGAVRVVTERRVPWEYLPDAMLREPKVWDALIDTIGLTALVRNLARMTRLGTLAPMNDATRRAAVRLTDAEALRRARLHPMDLFLALRVYRSGRSQPHPYAEAQHWSPVPAIVDALEEAFEEAFANVTPSGKRLLVAVDSSGSMSWRVMFGGSVLGSCYEVSNAMAVILARVEKGNLHVIDVDTSVHASKVTPRTNLREIATWHNSGGGTDLSLPFSWAQREGLEVDGFVVFTDQETWAGRIHPSQALDGYRRTLNPAARVVLATLAPNGRTIGEPGDRGVLNVGGLDASLPTLVNGFIRG